MTDAPSPPDLAALRPGRQLFALLALAAAVGVLASAAAWFLLELIHEIQHGVFDELPGTLGFDEVPTWWPLPVLAVAGVLCWFAIARLPGHGGHVPADGLDPSPTAPIELPGVILAAVASIGLGAVVGPEAPLVALGGGLGYFAINRLRPDAPPDLAALVAACGTFAALSFLFGSPIIAAVLLIEAAGIGGKRLPIVLIPGLLAAGIGMLVSLGLGSWSGVETDDISFSVLPLAEFARPDLADFLWTVPLAAAIAVGAVFIFKVARATHSIVGPRPILLPVVGLIVGGLAMVYSEAADRSTDQVLFSGQETLAPLIANADAWSVSALTVLIVFKGLAYALSLGSFRGGPAFPALFLGAAAGLIAAQLPGMEVTAAVSVGLGAATVAVLRLPLTAVVLATLLTSQGGLGAGPLVIVGVVVAYLVANVVDPRPDSTTA